MKRERDGGREREREGWRERERGEGERETDRQTDRRRTTKLHKGGGGRGGGVNVFQRTSRVERVKIEKKGDADHFMAS